MFDIGFWEIIFIMVITLLVIGPERLPRVARTAGLWLGKMRGFVSSVKADIDQELAGEELKKMLAKQASVPELEELVDKVTGNPLAAMESKLQNFFGFLRGLWCSCLEGYYDSHWLGI